MAMVKVWNDNVHPYKEKFKGMQIDIPARTFVEMPHDDAHLFLGTMSPMVRGSNGMQLPESYKKLRIEVDPKNVPKFRESHVCNACGIEFPNAKFLSHHSEVHKDISFSDPSVEAKPELQTESEVKEAPKRGRPRSKPFTV